MKSPLQTALVVVVLLALVGGITFVSQWMRPPDDKQPGPAPGVQAKLNFPKLVAGPARAEVTADKDKPPDALISEIYQERSYTFWLQNPAPQPVHLVGRGKSCTCSSVHLGTFTPEDWTSFQATPEAPAAVAKLNGGATVEELSQAAKAFLDRASWQPLEDKQTAAVPAATADGPAPALLRVTWKGRKMGPDRLSVTVADEDGYPYKLEIPIDILPPVFTVPVALHVDRPLVAGGGGQETVSFNCWSATRPSFGLDVRVAGPTPECFVVEKTPLTGADLEKAAGDAKALKPICGYRVSVTVYERRNGRQLDLGPFYRKVELRMPGEPEPHPMDLTGSVVGDVGIPAEEPKDRDRVVFTTFPSSRGMSKPVYLESNKPGLELELAEKSPDYLEVALGKPRTEGGRTTWELTVTVPPNRASGRFPKDAAVVLTIKGDPPRRIRLPVVGMATGR
jgi:hypothetical protein